MVWIDNAHSAMNPLPLLAVLWDKWAREDKCNFSIGIPLVIGKRREQKWEREFCGPVQLLLSCPCHITTAAPRVVQGKRHLPHCRFPLLSLASQTTRTKSSSTFSIFLIFRGTKRISNERIASSQFTKDCRCRTYSRLSLVSPLCLLWMKSLDEKPRRTENKEIFKNKPVCICHGTKHRQHKGTRSLTNEVSGTFWAG